MGKPLASVFMITYNHAPYIANAIDGVLKQKTNFQYELVIGEDCSTDGTREIVLKYYEKYPETIRLITSDKNIGAKQNGLRTERACRGKYMAFCEGDDYWHSPQKLQKQVEYLELNPECGLVFTDYNCYFVKSRKLIKNYRFVNGKLKNIPSNKNELLVKMLHAELGIQTCTVCLRKNLFDKLLNSDEFLNQLYKFPFGDTLRWVSISRLADLHCINESLATYNVLPESASQSENDVSHLVFLITQNEICLYLAQKYKLPESELQYFMKNLRNKKMKMAFLERNYEMANKLKVEIKQLTFKDQIFYWGTRFYLLYWIVRKYQRIKRLFFRSKY